MLLREVTQILKVLMGAFGSIASRDDLTQRRIGQIGEVIGAVDDLAEDEEAMDGGGGGETMIQRRVDEAHDLIHRVAAIVAMEEEGGDEPLVEVAWNGRLDGETIELKDDAEE